MDLTGGEAEVTENGGGEAGTVPGDDSDGSGYADSDEEVAAPGSGVAGGTPSVTFDEKPVVWVDETNVDGAFVIFSSPLRIQLWIYVSRRFNRENGVKWGPLVNLICAHRRMRGESLKVEFFVEPTTSISGTV